MDFRSSKGFGTWEFYHGTKYRSAVDFLQRLGYIVTSRSEVLA